jgi:L-iditol 2-dehydrogenase
MRSSVYRGPGRLEVGPRATERAGPGELVVEVKACGICGTDVHILDGEFPATPGIALGHEYAGIVREVGAGVTGVAPGDAVAIDPNIACGACPACRRGDVHLCDHLEALGVTRDGGFADLSRVPAGQAYRLPRELSFEAAAFAEPLSCCLHGLDLAGIRAGDRVAIVGAGPIGLLMVQLVRVSGAAGVTVIEPVPAKRALALEIGADSALDPAIPDLAVACREAAPAGFDAVLECVGRPATAGQALGLARRGGTVVWFGVSPPGATVAVEPYLVYRNELTIRAAFVNPRTFGRAVALLAQDRIRTAPLISHRFDLTSLAEGIATVKAGRAVKVLVLP